MVVVSHRIRCTGCDEETVLRDSELDDTDWKVEDKVGHVGLCPICNPAVIAEGETELNLIGIDNVGLTAAQNLSDAGFNTAESILNASRDELLEVSWVGEATVDNLKEAADRKT